MDTSLKKFLEKVAKQKEENDYKKELVKQPKYFDWLLKIIESNENSFCNAECQYLKESENGYTKEDIENIYMLHQFFEVINDYASQNYIVGDPNDYGRHYYISYNGICLEIGICIGQGSFVYVTKVELNYNSIDFDYVLGKTKNTKQEIIISNLTEFEGYIEVMVKNGIPFTSIQAKFTELENIYLKEDEY